jgi:hypothetical protein
MRRAGREVHMGEIINEYKIMVGNHKRKRNLLKSWRKAGRVWAKIIYV